VSWTKDYDLDHIGIAVNSLEEGKAFYGALGLGDMVIEMVESEKVKVGFFTLKNGSRIELLEPTSPDSTVAKFLAKRGPGIHHICLRVSQIRDVMKKLKAQGIRILSDEPSKGAHNCLVAFVHPQSAGGVLVELSEKMGK
jgi:methylmalonyl-CoA/ethylmalonyl-CoA epimerase